MMSPRAECKQSRGSGCCCRRSLLLLPHDAKVFRRGWKSPAEDVCELQDEEPLGQSHCVQVPAEPPPELQVLEALGQSHSVQALVEVSAKGELLKGPRESHPM